MYLVVCAIILSHTYGIPSRTYVMTLLNRWYEILSHTYDILNHVCFVCKIKLLIWIGSPASVDYVLISKYIVYASRYTTTQ